VLLAAAPRGVLSIFIVGVRTVPLVVITGPHRMVLAVQAVRAILFRSAWRGARRHRHYSVVRELVGAGRDDAGRSCRQRDGRRDCPMRVTEQIDALSVSAPIRCVICRPRFLGVRAADSVLTIASPCVRAERSHTKVYHIDGSLLEQRRGQLACMMSPPFD